MLNLKKRIISSLKKKNKFTNKKRLKQMKEFKKFKPVQLKIVPSCCLLTGKRSPTNFQRCLSRQSFKNESLNGFLTGINKSKNK